MSFFPLVRWSFSAPGLGTYQSMVSHDGMVHTHFIPEDLKFIFRLSGKRSAYELKCALTIQPDALRGVS